MTHCPELSTPIPKPDHQRIWCLHVILTVLIVFVFTKGIDGPFIFDDYPAIVNNPTISGQSVWRVLAGQRDQIYAARPLTNLSFAIDKALHGLNPNSFRWTNIIIHVITAWALLGLLSRLLALCWCRPEVNPQYTQWLAMVLTLMWALHPAQTECVLYITQRSLQLAMLCFVLSIDSLIKHHLTSKKHWLVLMILWGIVSMGFKQNAVVLPVVLLLVDSCILSGSLKNALKTRGKAHLLSALFIGMIATAILIYDPIPSSTGTRLGVTRWEYLMTQSQVILHYLNNCYWPSSLCLYYDWPIVRTFEQVTMSFITVGSLFVFGCLSLWRWPRIGCCVISVFLILAPTSSIIPVVSEVAADRRMHIILIFMLSLPVVTIINLCCRLQIPINKVIIAMFLLCMSITVTFACRTLQLAVFFDNPVLLWQHAIDHAPQPQASWEQLGGIYDRNQQWAPAWQCYQNAVTLEPDFALAKLNLGYVEMKLNRVDQAAYHLKAITDDPIQGADALHYLGMLYKQHKDYPTARHYLEQAHNRKPDREDIALNLAGIYNIQGDYAKVRQLLEPLVSRANVQAKILSELGFCYSQLDMLDQARLMYERYLAIKPADAKVLNSMGVVQAKLGHVPVAASFFARALAVDPDLQQAAENLQRARQMMQAPDNK